MSLRQCRSFLVRVSRSWSRELEGGGRRGGVLACLSPSRLSSALTLHLMTHCPLTLHLSFHSTHRTWGRSKGKGYIWSFCWQNKKIVFHLCRYMDVFKGMIQRPICWSDRMVTERAGGKMGEVWRRIYLGGNPLPPPYTPLSPRRRTPPPLPSLASLHSIESDQRSKITLGCWTSEMIQLSKFNFLSFGRFCNRFSGTLGFKKTLTL